MCHDHLPRNDNFRCTFYCPLSSHPHPFRNEWRSSAIAGYWIGGNHIKEAKKTFLTAHSDVKPSKRARKEDEPSSCDVDSLFKKLNGLY
uniref:THAP-type domain-containing protein n=1 Tax=Ascaris lumbricoides TaxID=6252 RepID=A0A0M3IF08_ASCLU